MKKCFFRLIALILLPVLILGVLPLSSEAADADKRRTNEAKPLYVYTEEDNALIEQDVFAQINRIEESMATKLGGVEHMSEQSYVHMLPQVIKAIESSETYVPGSLRENGVFLVWETTVGIPCCFDPRMEAKLRGNGTEASAEAIVEGEAAARTVLNGVNVMKSGPVSLKIGLIQPYWESSSSYADSSFNSYSPKYKAMWESLCSATGGEGMRYSMADASVDNIARVMSECGLVMFDSHGSTDYYDGNEDYSSRANCSYLCLTTSAGVTSEDTTAQTGPYGTYYHCLKGSDYAFVSGTCIANHMSGYAPNSFLYMGICLGMATDGMCRGLRGKGVEAVYGYSQSVSFSGDTAYLNDVVGAIRDGCTLGEALSAAKETLGPWDCYRDDSNYDSAIQNHRAFPVVASSEDPYPGHGNVDALQNVDCSWSLHGSNYLVTAVSNNTQWGTVQVLGYTVVADPAPGYYAADCKVLSGTASVIQDGNLFYLKVSSDCQIQIRFAAKTPANITFLANGIVYDTISAYVGDEISLPTELSSNVEGWSFKGWVCDPIPESRERPAFRKPGASFTPQADTTFYALYVHVEAGSGDETAYELLSQAPQNWEGNYVISYGIDSDMYLFTGMAGTDDGVSIECKDNATAFSDTTLTLDENLLYDVPDCYLFSMEAKAHNAYCLQSVSTGAYYGSNEYSILAFSHYVAEQCDWIPGVGENASCLRSVIDGSYPFFSFLDSDQFFWAYPERNPSIRLWKETTLGSRIYSTNLNPFVDVRYGRYYFDAVQWAFHHTPRVTSGTDATHFSPNLFCTREQIVFFLWAAAGKPVPSATDTAFTDVKPNQYYAEAVLWAEENGITRGVSETSFGVGKYCSRAQIVTFLWRAAGSVKPTEANAFQDIPAKAYYADAANWAAEHGVANGTAEGTFSPEKLCTRAEAVSFLYAARTIIDEIWR